MAKTARTIKKVVEEKDRLVPAKKARERLGISERSERIHIAEGRLKPVKLGRRNYYSEAYLDDIVANGTG